MKESGVRIGEPWTPEIGKKELKYYTKGNYTGGVEYQFLRRYVNFYPNGTMGIISRIKDFKNEKMTYSLHIFKLVERRWAGVADFENISDESKLGKNLINLEKKGAFNKR